MNFIIYRFTNTINNKMYIGLTTQSLKKRVYLHFWVAKRNPTSHFARALRKYPKDSWVIEILEEGTTDSKEFIKSREVHFVSLYETYVNGYNSTPGGDDFTDSEFQRENQKNRVKRGTHPFLGGEIQRVSSKRRWDNGSSNLIGLNQVRIEQGSHNLLGDSNPMRVRKMQGVAHHNHRKPWLNTKSSKTVSVWLKADILYDWWIQNHTVHGPYAMAKHHNIGTSLQVMYYKYFNNGWNPREDEEWMSWKNANTN